MKSSPGIKCYIHILALTCALATPVYAQEAPVPNTAPPDTSITKRVSDDLEAFYSDKEKKAGPPYAKAIEELKDADAAKRTAAGAYLLELLKQTLSDQKNGRAPSKSLPFWGGGVENTAMELRKQIAGKFGASGGGEAGLDAAQWLVDEDPVLDNQLNGFKFVLATKSPRADDIIKTTLAAPHHNEEVLTRAIQEAVERKLPVVPEITRLCGWHRKKVRETARDAATKLDIKDIPGFKPEEALTPWLEEQLKNIAAMPYPEIPKEAVWMRFTPIKDGKPVHEGDISGWLVGEKDGKIRIMNYFGSIFEVDAKIVKKKPRAFADDAVFFTQARKPQGKPEDERNALAALSVRGMLTGQFEPRYISAPEALVAAWSFQHGDKKLAAQILLPRLDESVDDREFFRAVQELLGRAPHQSMLEAFCENRDYAEALRVAKHLSQPVFDGYFYQTRAKELAAQLEKRGDDFKTFTLPAPEAWEKQKADMNRTAQIEFLAAHLRLLNCVQWGQPGDVNYTDAQHSSPLSPRDAKPVIVINPFNELRAMKMSAAELATLAPYLADENFIPTYSYWRDFHPGRHLHRVNWLASTIFNEAAGGKIVDLANFQSLDAAGKQKLVDTALAWCRENGSKSLETRLLERLTAAKEWDEFARVASQAVREKILPAALVLEKRMPEFDARNQGEIMEFCYALNNPEALPFARDWLAAHRAVPKGDWTGEDAVRYWTTMMVLRASKPGAPEGLDVMSALLDKVKDVDEWYPQSFDLLLSLKNNEATDIATGVLKKMEQSGGSFNTSEITKRLFLAGRKEALDFMLAWLDKEGDGGTSWKQTDDGKQITIKRVKGDSAAEAVAEWRTDKYSYEIMLPAERRKAERVKLKQWLKEQFALVKEGKETAISKPNPIQASHFTLDAP